MMIPEATVSGRPLSIRAFAEAADTSPRRIRRLIRQGRLRTIENQAGEIRVPEGELERLESWRESRIHRQSLERSLEMASVSIELEPRITRRDDAVKETYAMEVPLSRHEAALMRLGYLESELASLRQRLKEREHCEQDLEDRAESAEAELAQVKLKAAETEARLEEMRSQVIDCTFKAVELQDEVKRLQEKLMSSWWSRLIEAVGQRKTK